MWLDVNGSKNPNTIGRDIFQFLIGQNGVLYPTGSQAMSEMDNGVPNKYYWRTTSSSTYKCDNSSNSWGWGCAARVLEEDAMNY